MLPDQLIPEILTWDHDRTMLEQRYEFVAPWCRGHTVVVAACGLGYGSKMLAENGASHVVGVDRTETAVQLASIQAAHPRLKFVRAEVSRPETLEVTVDVVISFDTIEHLADPEAFFRGVRRILKPKGLFVCSTSNKNFAGRAYSVNPYQLSELTLPEFSSLFETYFHVEHKYHQSPTLAYTRHCLLVREVEDVQYQLMSSRVIGIERLVRKALGRKDWDEATLSSDLWRPVPGDYVIEAFEKPSPHHQTYILVGSAPAGQEITQIPFATA